MKSSYHFWPYVLIPVVVLIVLWSVYDANLRKAELKAADVDDVQEVMLEPTVHPLTGKTFNQYLARRSEFLVKVTPEGIDKLFTVKGAVTPCEADSDGPCGFDLEIWGPVDWQNKPEQNYVFYFAEQGQNGRIFYGPFEDHLLRVMEEARTWENK